MNATLPASSTNQAARQPVSWPDIALFALGVSVTLYLNLTEIAGLDVRPVQLAPLVAAAAALVLLPSLHKRIPRAYFIIPCVWASYMLTRHYIFDDEGLHICARTLANVAAYLAALKLMLRTGRPHWLMAGLLIGMLVSVLLSAANFSVPNMVSSSVRMGNGRWQGLMPGANRFANLCAITFITGVGWLLLQRRFSSRFMLALGCFGALSGLAMSGSRGATLATAVSTILLLWMVSREQGRFLFSPRMLICGGVALLMCWVLFIYNKEMIPERLVALIDSPDDAIAKIEDDSRRDLFEISYEIFLESPLFGGGASAAVFTMPTKHGEIEITSHNMYLKFLTSSGLAGLVGYLAMPLFMLVQLGYLIIFQPHSTNHGNSSVPLALSWLLLILVHGCVISIGQTAHAWLFYSAAAFTCIEQSRAYRGAFAKKRTRPLSTVPHRHNRPLKPRYAS